MISVKVVPNLVHPDIDESGQEGSSHGAAFPSLPHGSGSGSKPRSTRTLSNPRSASRAKGLEEVAEFQTIAHNLLSQRRTNSGHGQLFLSESANDCF